MSALFCYDGPLYDVQGQFHDFSLSNDYFYRYINVFGDMKIITRIRKSNSIGMSELQQNQLHIFNTENFKYIDFIKLIKNEVKKNDYVVIKMPSFIGIFAIYYAKKFNKKYIIEMVGCPLDTFWNHSLKGKFISPILYFVNKVIIKNAEFVSYVSENFLQKRYPTRGYSIAISDVILIDHSISNLYKRIERSRNHILKIATIASYDVKYKGQKYVIRALSSLKKKGIKMEYHLVGGGNNARLMKFARKLGVENIIMFHGQIKHDEIFSFLDKMDGYIQPSLAESHGRVLVEAISRGCPVMGSNVGGIPEIVSPEFVFKPKNYKDIEKKLLKFANSDLNELSKNAFNKSLKFESNRLNSIRKDFYTKIKNQ